MNPASGLVFVKRCEWVIKGFRCPSPALGGEQFCLEHCAATAAGHSPGEAEEKKPDVSARTGSAAAAGPGDGPQEDAAAPAGAASGRTGARELRFGSNLMESEGRARFAISLMREYSAGRLDRRRFEALLGGVRLIATLIGEPPAPPGRRASKRDGAPVEEPVLRKIEQRLGSARMMAKAPRERAEAGENGAQGTDSTTLRHAACAAARRPGLIDRTNRRVSGLQAESGEPGVAGPGVSRARSKRSGAIAPGEQRSP